MEKEHYTFIVRQCKRRCYEGSQEGSKVEQTGKMQIERGTRRRRERRERRCYEREKARQRCCKSLFKMANSCHDILKLTLASSAAAVVAAMLVVAAVVSLFAVLVAVVVVVMLGINYERR